MPPSITISPSEHNPQLQQYLNDVQSCESCVAQWNPHRARVEDHIWPLTDDGVPVPPKRLEEHGRTHEYPMPCCLCPFLLKSTIYRASKVGLVQFVGQGETDNEISYHTKYVAACAEQRCGYLVVLDDRFNKITQPTRYFRKRDKRGPLWNDPFHFNETEEEVKMSGIRQICSDLQDDSTKNLRGTRKLLRQEDPQWFADMENDLAALVFKGLPAQQFWDLFAQCTRCRFVLPRHYFPYAHKCVTEVVRRNMDLRGEMDIDDPLKSSFRHRRPGALPM